MVVVDRSAERLGPLAELAVDRTGPDARVTSPRTPLASGTGLSSPQACPSVRTSAATPTAKHLRIGKAPLQRRFQIVLYPQLMLLPPTTLRKQMRSASE